MQFRLFDKTYGDDHSVYIDRNYNVKNHPTPNGTAIINAYTLDASANCSACDKPLRKGQRVARPNYPAQPPYSGEPETIGDRVVAKDVIFCQSCVTAVAPEVVL